MSLIRCPAAIVEETLESLRAAGRAGNEGVALWLASRQAAASGVSDIVRCYVPRHSAEEDRFWIPKDAMHEMMEYLFKNKLRLAAQVHSHPGEAFHSLADDRWALPSQPGALSIVVPDFAVTATAANFIVQAAIYCLSKEAKWKAVKEPAEFLEILS